MASSIKTPEDLIERIHCEVVGLTEHDGGILRGDVPLGLIDGKDVPVNNQNLEVIGRQLEEEAAAKGTNGQIQAIMLGLVAVHTSLDIIDGFHRFKRFQLAGRDTIYSTIIAVTLDELLDKRIQNTSNHAGLQFARASSWVRESWSLHPLSERIAATSAFVLGRIKSSTGSRLGLDKDEVREVMDWVNRKSALWGVEPLTIYGYLHTDENVDSLLVHNSRPDARQSAEPESLPQSTLATIGKQIPKRPVLQLAVAKAITEHRLGGSGISGILSDVKAMGDEEALEYLGTVDFSAYKEKIAQKPVYKYSEDDILRVDRVRESSRVRPLSEMAKLTIINIDLELNEGKADPKRMGAVATELSDIASQLQQQADKINQTITGNKQTPEAPTSVIRSADAFTNILSAFLRNPQTSFEILTDREARTVERAISRGRGKQESLEKLEAALRAYNGDEKIA